MNPPTRTTTAPDADRDRLGGHVSQLLLEKVARKRIAFVHSRWMNVST